MCIVFSFKLKRFYSTLFFHFTKVYRHHRWLLGDTKSTWVLNNNLWLNCINYPKFLSNFII